MANENDEKKIIGAACSLYVDLKKQHKERLRSILKDKFSEPMFEEPPDNESAYDASDPYPDDKKNLLDDADK